ncbi:TPA: hypothetical protein OUE28_003544 [Morganella morganii]|nr:hypothetical protein [Morganella morganii]
MSDKKDNSSNKTENPGFYVDTDCTFTMKDFFNYLEEKGVSSKCPACGKMTMSGVIAVGEGQALAINAMNKDASRIFANECVGRICLSCSNVQFFWMSTMKSWMNKKERKSIEE